MKITMIDFDFERTLKAAAKMIPSKSVVEAYEFIRVTVRGEVATFCSVNGLCSARLTVRCVNVDKEDFEFFIRPFNFKASDSGTNVEISLSDGIVTFSYLNEGSRKKYLFAQSTFSEWDKIDEAYENVTGQMDVQAISLETLSRAVQALSKIDKGMTVKICRREDPKAPFLLCSYTKGILSETLLVPATLYKPLSIEEGEEDRIDDEDKIEEEDDGQIRD